MNNDLEQARQRERDANDLLRDCCERLSSVRAHVLIDANSWEAWCDAHDARVKAERKRAQARLQAAKDAVVETAQRWRADLCDDTELLRKVTELNALVKESGVRDA